MQPSDPDGQNKDAAEHHAEDGAEASDPPRGGARHWAERYASYYPVGSRADYQFRVMRRLVLVARRWRTRVDEELKHIGQTRARWETMAALAFSGSAVSVADLSERAGVQWPTLVRMINGLEADGLLRRFENPLDGRSRLVELTPRGEATMRKIQQIVNPLREHLLCDATDQELLAANAVLEKMLDRLGGDVFRLMGEEGGQATASEPPMATPTADQPSLGRKRSSATREGKGR